MLPLMAAAMLRYATPLLMMLHLLAAAFSRF